MEGPISFNLLIAKNNGEGFREVLIIPDTKTLFKSIELNFLAITNGFLHGDLARQIPKYPEGYAGKERYYTKVLNELISYCYLSIGEPIIKSAAEIDLIYRTEVFERFMPLDRFAKVGITHKEIFMIGHPLEQFVIETKELYLALKEWLLFSPNIKKSPSERYCEAYQLMSSAEDLPLPVSPDTLSPFLSRMAQVVNGKEGRRLLALGVLYGFKRWREAQLIQSLTDLGTGKKVRRTRDTSSGEIKEIVEKTILSRSYVSKTGLLPLAWAEILYCVENDLVIKTCGECGSLFHVKSNGTYCSEACKKRAKKRKDDLDYELEKKAKKLAQEGRPLEEIIQLIREIKPGCRPDTIKKWAMKGLS